VESQFGSILGVVRTRVGYSGGKKEDPTYYSLGDHTETVQVDFDPSRISYRELLEVFWATPNSCERSGKRQYMSAVFYHNEEQKQQALETKDREAARRQQKIGTAILPATTFYLAEDYHQKYLLQQRSDLMREFRAMYPEPKYFVASTAAAHVNGYLGLNGSYQGLQKEIDSLGLSPAGKAALEELWKRAH
jgi:peptide-methionine (S)-S-oxide reductase